MLNAPKGAMDCPTTVVNPGLLERLHLADERVGFADAAQSGRLISELDGQRAGAREIAALCAEVGRLAP